MKSINEYFDDLKSKTGSDYATAKALGLNKVTISSARRRGQISDETAIAMADLLGIDQDEMLIAAAIARSEGATKTAWINHAKRFGIAASLAAYTLTPIISGLQKCILC